jgi:hypothetical protein
MITRETVDNPNVTNIAAYRVIKLSDSWGNEGIWQISPQQ